MLDYCQYIVLQIAPAYSVVLYYHSTKWVSISNTICHFRFYDICHYMIISKKVPMLLRMGTSRNNLGTLFRDLGLNYHHPFELATETVC